MKDLLPLFSATPGTTSLLIIIVCASLFGLFDPSRFEQALHRFFT